MRRPTALSILALGLIALPAAAQALDARAQRGETIARTHCARCHAIGRVGASPLAEAPPFRELHHRYPVTDLSEALAEGITTGHPSMPEFRLDPDQAQALISYLQTLER
ncbi:MAG TPA: cytochrome c [Methylobacterium sp.]|jgi:mono/diheme cytochrome c family protein|uniref:c-type cytochrome n=1 Tax=Methylorubrum sp. B1-46 TaxID=2897334 RepID=UPI001E3E603A|nr:cytochrome c [Methylorubrum sp. B1-46]UGB27335.1 cytochrome c [Methylorubrum sp. B1-46]HEV2543793.1 cytochrome c [Methylobacterium sp.]